MSQTPNTLAASSNLRKTYKRQSQAKDIWRRFCKNKMAVAALIILSIIVLAACSIYRAASLTRSSCGSFRCSLEYETSVTGFHIH